MPLPAQTSLAFPRYFLMTRRPPRSTLFPYTTLFRAHRGRAGRGAGPARHGLVLVGAPSRTPARRPVRPACRRAALGPPPFHALGLAPPPRPKLGRRPDPQATRSQTGSATRFNRVGKEAGALGIIRGWLLRRFPPDHMVSRAYSERVPQIEGVPCLPAAPTHPAAPSPAVLWSHARPSLHPPTSTPRADRRREPRRLGVPRLGLYRAAQRERPAHRLAVRALGGGAAVPAPLDPPGDGDRASGRRHPRIALPSRNPPQPSQPSLPERDPRPPRRGRYIGRCDGPAPARPWPYPGRDVFHPPRPAGAGARSGGVSRVRGAGDRDRRSRGPPRRLPGALWRRHQRSEERR